MPPLFEHYAVVIPDEHLLVAFHHEQTGVPDRLICTYGLDVNDATPAEADLEAIADSWATRVMGTMGFTSQTLVQVTFANADGVVFSIDRDDSGIDTNPQSPVSNAFIVEKRTGVAGRRNRGRIYLPMVQESAVDGAGRLDTATRDNVTDNLEDFRTDVEALAGGTYDLVILHSQGWNGAVKPPDPGNAPPPTVITSHYTRPVIGTQRRRLR